MMHIFFKHTTGFLLFSGLLLFGLFFQMSCSKEEPDNPLPPADTTDGNVDTLYLKNFSDTYYDLYSFNMVYQWGPYNVHDPSVIFDGQEFFCYSTDVFYGLPVERAGIQVRRSEDLVRWNFSGWAFNSIPSQAADYIISNGSTPVDNVWAPYIINPGSEFRLYYSQAALAPKLSAIGLTTGESTYGPWIEKGLVVTSNNSIVMPNAIDPTVIIDKNGKHWMFYGSSWDGIYILELNPETGLALTANSKGRRIAHRGFTNNMMNGNIEASEIIYNPDFEKYYLFISYDWLETKYNVRVGRADNVEGPYYDYHHTDMNQNSDNIPMILAPYSFSGHSGWQGTGHCSVFSKDGQFYIAHQGRPAINKYFMDLHVRRILWTDDGWPVVSPQRYAGITTSEIDKDEITGTWEYIRFEYTVVPGFAEEQTNPDIQRSVEISFQADGTINDEPLNTWTFEDSKLVLNWNNTIEKTMVERGWDWEKKRETLLFTGLDNNGKTIWGKKVR